MRTRPSNVMESVMKNLSKSGIVIKDIQEMRDSQYGMPLPHLSLQYLFASTAVRFGNVYMLQGPPASCKSPFGFYMLRTMALDQEHGGYGGVSYLSELESKVSTDLLDSFIDRVTYPELKATFGQVTKEDDLTLDSALDSFNKIVAEFASKYPNNDVPILWDMDSIGGAATEESVKKTEQDGSLGRGFADKPLMLKNFFETFSSIVGKVPVILFTVNHEKPAMQQGYGAPANPKANGGESQKFKAAINLKFSAMKFQNKAEGMGKKVTIQTYKNSFGTDRKIVVNFVWRQPTADDPKQYHHWDWAKATMDLLAAPPTGTAAAIHELVDVTVMSTDARRCNCPKLGLTGATAEEFEEELNKHPDILQKLRNILQISEVQTLDQFLDRKERRKKEEAAAKKEAKKANSGIAAKMAEVAMLL